MKIDFYFDFSCPYAYLASKKIGALAEKYDAKLQYRPMLLGGVFRSLSGDGDGPMTRYSPAKEAHNHADMTRWAELFHTPLVMPSNHPNRTVLALRTLLTFTEVRWPEIISSLFDSYWKDGNDISDPKVVAEALKKANLSKAETEEALVQADTDASKKKLRLLTDNAVAAGVFGAPTMNVNVDGTLHLFWGQDRLTMVEQVLKGWNPAQKRTQSSPLMSPTKTTNVEFWYDFSSPYAYLGFTQLRRLEQQYGIKIKRRPMLLGAVFKAVGAPMIPLHVMPKPKQMYNGRELIRWANYFARNFQFTSQFPINSVKALRLALLAGDKIDLLSEQLYEAAWVNNRDISDPATLQDILSKCCLPVSLVERTKDPEVKELLKAATQSALDKGIFGAPTWIVKTETKDYLLWGQDRIEMLEKILQGFRPSL